MLKVIFLAESHRIRAEEEEESLLDSYSTPAKVRKIGDRLIWDTWWKCTVDGQIENPV